MNKPSDTTKKIAGNTVFQLVGKVVSMSVTILATIILTRVYGREGFGEFNLMQTFPALFYIIVDFGINAIAARELTTDWSKAEKYLGNILVIRTLTALLVMGLSAVALIFFPYTDALRIGIYLSLFLILTQALYATTNIIFQVKLRYDLTTIGTIAGSLVILFLVVTASYLRLPVIWASFSYVIGGLVTVLLNLMFISRLGIKIRPEFDPQLVKFLLIQSLPLGLMFIFSQINFKMDAIFLSVMDLPRDIGLSNTESVAVYGLPYKVFEVSLVLPTFFMNAAYPVMVRHMLEGKEKLKESFSRILLFLSALGLIVGLIGVLVAPFVIGILGGNDFSRSVLVLQILVGGLIIFYSTQPVSWLIVTLGGQRFLPAVYLVSAVFNVTANLLLIPVYSFYASSVITIVSELIILVLLMFVARRVWVKHYA